MSLERLAGRFAAHITALVRSTPSNDAVTTVHVVAYRPEDHDPRWTGVASAAEHRRLIKMTAARLPHDIRLAVVMFDQDDYAEWRSDRTDTRALRAEWASVTGVRLGFSIGPRSIGWAAFRSRFAGGLSGSGTESL